MNRKLPLLAVAGGFTGIIGLAMALVLWIEGFTDGGFKEFKTMFSKSIFTSSALRRYWLAMIIGILLISLSVPAFMYGARTHPYLTYYGYYSYIGSGLTFQYPRDWRRDKTSLSIGNSDDPVIIRVSTDTTLPHGDGNSLTVIKTEMGKLLADKSIAVVNRIGTVSSASGLGVLTDTDMRHNGRMKRVITVYVPDKDCWYTLTLFNPDENAVREGELIRMVRSLRIVHKASSPTHSIDIK